MHQIPLPYWSKSQSALAHKCKKRFVCEPGEGIEPL